MQLRMSKARVLTYNAYHQVCNHMRAMINSRTEPETWALVKDKANTKLIWCLTKGKNDGTNTSDGLSGPQPDGEVQQPVAEAPDEHQLVDQVAQDEGHATDAEEEPGPVDSGDGISFIEVEWT
jgi:hypothetical protein